MTIAWNYNDALSLVPDDYTAVLREDADATIEHLTRITELLAQRLGGTLSIHGLAGLDLDTGAALDLLEQYPHRPRPTTAKDVKQVEWLIGLVRLMAMAKIHQQVADEHGKLSSFARQVLSRSAFQGADLCGADAQDMAVEHGLLHAVEVSEPCNSDYCTCAEVSDPPWTCYQLTEMLKAGSHE